MAVALGGVLNRDWKSFEVRLRNTDVKENGGESSEKKE